MNHIILATQRGIVIFQHNPINGQEPARSLSDQNVTSVTARDGTIIAGTEDGIFRSIDAGKHWEEASEGLTIRHVRWMAHHPDVATRIFAGTEPAGIFVSQDAGMSWRLCPEVAELRDQHRWSLPYSPEAGCVRGFAFHGSRLYAAVEVGGVLVSDNNGETWQLAEGSDGNPDFEGPPEPFVYPDVHSIEVHPSSLDLVYAPTGGGFYRSNDGGRTWRLLYDCYCRAVWVDPNDSDRIILGPADYVDSNGRIEESRDGGHTWSLASNGLKVPWHRGMVERFFQADQELYAVLSSGQVFRTSLPDLEWQRALPGMTGVNAMALVA
ncbi:MAG TPA: sialidase family protein [Anaerolineales bacterium]|nr:sialidase family protein [Anaerolineales bacterium]